MPPRASPPWRVGSTETARAALGAAGTAVARIGLRVHALRACPGSAHRCVADTAGVASTGATHRPLAAHRSARAAVHRIALGVHARVAPQCSVCMGIIGVHRHVLLTQISGVVHVVPQAPQLLLSDIVSTHRALAPVPHIISPAAHIARHAPPVQTVFGPQVEPHVPQFAGSFCVDVGASPGADRERKHARGRR